MQRFLITLGIILVLVGILLPILSKIGLGRLPGDILINKANLKIYFPITTSIIVSIILSIIFWIFSKK